MVTTETFSVYQNIIFELIVPSQPWCDPLFETRGATHCFLQHRLVIGRVFQTQERKKERKKPKQTNKQMSLGYPLSVFNKKLYSQTKRPS